MGWYATGGDASWTDDDRSPLGAQRWTVHHWQCVGRSLWEDGDQRRAARAYKRARQEYDLYLYELRRAATVGIDEPHEDEEGLCITCGCFIGDGEYECSVPGGASCVAGERAAQRVLLGLPVEPTP